MRRLFSRPLFERRNRPTGAHWPPGVGRPRRPLPIQPIQPGPPEAAAEAAAASSPAGGAGCLAGCRFRSIWFRRSKQRQARLLAARCWRAEPLQLLAGQRLESLRRRTSRTSRSPLARRNLCFGSRPTASRPAERVVVVIVVAASTATATATLAARKRDKTSQQQVKLSQSFGSFEGAATAAEDGSREERASLGGRQRSH